MCDVELMLAFFKPTTNQPPHDYSGGGGAVVCGGADIV
jgi:hypothetical protein